MKYIANPVKVDAFKIEKLITITPVGQIILRLESGEEVIATKEMLSRIHPSVGDYWVIQSDGYVYLNPKDVFERKYRRADVEELPDRVSPANPLAPEAT